jgi:hypothetical protein
MFMSIFDTNNGYEFTIVWYIAVSSYIIFINLKLKRFADISLRKVIDNATYSFLLLITSLLILQVVPLLLPSLRYLYNDGLVMLQITPFVVVIASITLIYLVVAHSKSFKIIFLTLLTKSKISFFEIIFLTLLLLISTSGRYWILATALIMVIFFVKEALFTKYSEGQTSNPNSPLF